MDEESGKGIYCRNTAFKTQTLGRVSFQFFNIVFEVRKAAALQLTISRHFPATNFPCKSISRQIGQSSKQLRSEREMFGLEFVTYFYLSVLRYGSQKINLWTLC